MTERRNRSQNYQALFCEIAWSNDMLESFSNCDSISNRLNPFAYDERLLDLEDQLRDEFWRIVDSLLTTRQKEVLRLLADGKTQTEVAKALGVNQSSITKSVHGNTAYDRENKNLDNKTSYGGSKKKLRKIIENDPKIKEILAKMNEIRNEKW